MDRPRHRAHDVTLLAHPHLIEQSGPIRQAAWYRKKMPTFADTLALVRREIWTEKVFASPVRSKRR
jgi:hypothetical protein